MRKTVRRRTTADGGLRTIRGAGLMLSYGCLRFQRIQEDDRGLRLSNRSFSLDLLLAGTEEGVSREWSNTGSFKELVVRIENYVFDQTRPALSAAQREEVWKKESRCERPPGGQDGPWRWCLSGQKPPD